MSRDRVRLGAAEAEWSKAVKRAEAIARQALVRANQALGGGGTLPGPRGILDFFETTNNRTITTTEALVDDFELSFSLHEPRLLRVSLLVNLGRNNDPGRTFLRPRLDGDPLLFWIARTDGGSLTTSRNTWLFEYLFEASAGPHDMDLLGQVGTGTENTLINAASGPAPSQFYVEDAGPPL